MEIVGTDAAEDGRLSQSLPGSVAGLSAMLDHVSIRADVIYIISPTLVYLIAKLEFELQDNFT